MGSFIICTLQQILLGDHIKEHEMGITCRMHTKYMLENLRGDTT